MTSMRNWMVFDYYMAVRLTAINWIESQSTSFTSLSPCHSSFHLIWLPFSICLYYLFFLLDFFICLVPRCPCFSSFFLSLRFILMSPPSSNLSPFFHFVSPCLSRFPPSSRFPYAFLTHMPAFFSLPVILLLYRFLSILSSPSYSLSTRSLPLISLSLLPPPLSSLLDSLTS